ncbi:KH domain-containing protein At4g18375 isoform X1 [Amborella trichopoda]|uniref:KH domain-containing protein At4g18375 isoform X1 n=1 Tax=Amborella trichopoda TaxID=13333 RepID=UPI0009C025D3|nr:KH domain-containing protein At4g18375 isoform X1 [Amborella trichopoda]XP_020520837.1 KH domain-containing protein At4g18375 isoform X1 [Amborella trichopoda]|eukprot:XP_020520832.1 KH domain-containing protein At4g18375 isoform X1 [Amborella trichopoda]
MAGHRNYSSKRSHSQADSMANFDNGSKRRNPGEEREQYAPGPEDTVYRYLCPAKKIGSIIGKGGEIVKTLRAESQSKIRIGETIHGCEERIVTIFSSRMRNQATYDESGLEFMCSAQDALFRVHDRLLADETPGEEGDDTNSQNVTARLLVPADQIGCIIGKGGQIIQNMRSETGAHIRILKNEQLPLCAMASDELLQISGDASVVRKALYQVSSRLHENPSRSQGMLSSGPMIPPGGQFFGPNSGASYYGGYKGDVGGDWAVGPSQHLYSGARDDSSAKEFGLRLVCPSSHIGGVIGKGGVIIKQIRQESGAFIKVESNNAEGDDCVIAVSAKEYFDDPFSPTIDAAVRLQPKCSEKTERESGEPSFTTRLLVPSSRIGCLIGKGGSIISEMRKMTRANIRIFSKENLPKVASEDDEMVQISGELDVARNALIQVATRLKANFFEREGSFPVFPSSLPYLPMSADVSAKPGGRGYSYSGTGLYGASGDVTSDSYGNYASGQSGSSGGYGSYGGYTSGRSGSGPPGRELQIGHRLFTMV